MKAFATLVFFAGLALVATLTNGCGGSDSPTNLVAAPVLVAPAPIDGRAELPFRMLNDHDVGDDVAGQIPTNVLHTSRSNYLDIVRRIKPRFTREDIPVLESASDKLHWGKESLLLLTYGGNTCVTHHIERIIYYPETKKLVVEYSQQDFGGNGEIVDIKTHQALPQCAKACGFIDASRVVEVAVPTVDADGTEYKMVPTSPEWSAQSCREKTDVTP